VTGARTLTHEQGKQIPDALLCGCEIVDCLLLFEMTRQT
jgi:hypothetical protein